MRVRQYVCHALDHACDSRRSLRQLPPVLYGKQKLLDTAGRVERFRQKYATKAS